MPEFKTIIEPFRIKSVEPLRLTTPAERIEILESAGHNLFRIRSVDVLIDLLTDSGTSAMSAEQWAALMRGDESYAGSPSYYRFEKAVRDLTGMENVIPVHQGRAAEKILFSLVGGAGRVVPGNRHFDTTRANIEFSGAQALDLPCVEARDSSSMAPFKGNIDLDALERLLKERAADVPLCVMTLTDNAGGGQPVSLANMQAARQLLDRFSIPLLVDCARFAENAFLVKQREAGQGDRTATEIAREFFSLADGASMSAKKDGLANMGGFLALRNRELAEQARQLLILTEGFTTYGGLAGRDLEAVAQGLTEVLDEDYLRYRVRSVEYLGEGLRQAGMPIVEPPGGHAIYIDARRFLPHIPPAQLPAQSLSCALYVAGGIRSVEVGTVMFGKTDPDSGLQVPSDKDLVRLALPRRVYTQSHVDYVVEVCAQVAEERERLRGYRITEEPAALRHFTASFSQI